MQKNLADDLNDPGFENGTKRSAGADAVKHRENIFRRLLERGVPKAETMNSLLNLVKEIKP